VTTGRDRLYGRGVIRCLAGAGCAWSERMKRTGLSELSLKGYSLHATPSIIGKWTSQPVSTKKM
jgi:hypothetical protein